MGLGLDAILVAFMLLHTWLGWRSGLLRQAVTLASAVLGVVLGLALAPAVGALFLGVLTTRPFHAQLAGFILVAASTAFLLRMVAAWAEWQSEDGVPKKEREQRRSQDRILGGMFAAIKAVTMVMVFIAGAVSLWPGEPLWEESGLARPFASAGAHLVPEGAAHKVHDWLAASTNQLRKELDIKTCTESAEAEPQR